MRRIAERSFFFVLLSGLIVCFLFVGAMTASASEAETGLAFVAAEHYEASGVSMPLPTTFEATVTLPEGYTSRAGVIIGDYAAGKKPCFNFEIHQNGAPRIFIWDGAEVNFDVIFNEVNVCTGKPVHVAVTVENENWCCYIDGELKQTAVKAMPTAFDVRSFCVGGDFRIDNTQYFKGRVHSLALYSSVRTAENILTDASAAEFDTEGLLTAYRLPARGAKEEPLKTVPSAADATFDLAYCGPYFEEWIKEVDEPDGYAYSFAVIGDIQSLNYYYPDELTVMYEWIRDNAEEKKIMYAVGLGDITENNTTAEYERVNEAYSLIDGVVPYSIIRGNHDRSGDSSAMYDKYITQEKHGDEITGSYDETMLNTYRILQVGEVKYLFMNLDFLLKDEVLTWAGDVIADNPDCHVIVSTHIYMTHGGDYYTLEGEDGIGTKYYCENNGQGLRDKLLCRHDNIVMVLCGHNPTDDIYYRTHSGDSFNSVAEILVDPQTTDKNYGGTGLVAMFYFSEDGKRLDVRYYSTVKDAYFKTNNQFSIELDTFGVNGPHDCAFELGEYDGGRHWTECSVCGKREGIAAHSPTDGVCECGWRDPTYVPETTEEPETSEAPETSAVPETTIVPETSVEPESSAEPETSITPETSTELVTSEKPETSAAPETTPSPDTSGTPPPPYEPQDDDTVLTVWISICAMVLMGVAFVLILVKKRK